MKSEGDPMTEQAAKVKKPMFKIGQIVCIDTEYYRTSHKSEQYQRITARFDWKKHKPHPFGYTFANGDRANEKYLRPLTKREAGR